MPFLWHLSGIFVAGTYFATVWGNVAVYWFLVDVCSNVGSICNIIVYMHWNLYVQCGKLICSGSYVSSVKCMYASTPGHIIDY